MMRTERLYQPSIGILEWYRIYGSFHESVACLADLLQNEGPPLADSVAALLDTLRQPEVLDAYEDLGSDDQRTRWREMSRLAASELDSNSEQYRSAVGDSTFEAARSAAQDIVLAWQSLDEYMAMPEDQLNIRDASMAENISWMLSEAGDEARIVLWAHNLHVTRKPAQPGYGSMGNELERMYGDDHVVIGFSFDEGSFQAAYMEADSSGQYVQKLGEFFVDEAADSTIAGLLATAGIPMLFIDLAGIPSSGVVRDWFSAERLMRSIGAGYSYDNPERYFEPVVLPDHFDAVLFIDSTTAARPNERTRQRFHATD